MERKYLFIRLYYQNTSTASTHTKFNMFSFSLETTEASYVQIAN